MRAQAFTDEEVKILRENKYTSFVSNSSIRLTLEFKEMFMERKQQGITARRIFKEAGYDVDMNFDPNPILWTLENTLIPIRGHQTVPLL